MILELCKQTFFNGFWNCIYVSIWIRYFNQIRIELGFVYYSGSVNFFSIGLGYDLF